MTSAYHSLGLFSGVNGIRVDAASVLNGELFGLVEDAAGVGVDQNVLALGGDGGVEVRFAVEDFMAGHLEFFEGVDVV